MSHTPGPFALPETWKRTRTKTLPHPQNVVIYFGRDTRWPSNVPDLAATSLRDLCRQAWECFEADNARAEGR